MAGKVLVKVTFQINDIYVVLCCGAKSQNGLTRVSAYTGGKTNNYVTPSWASLLIKHLGS